MKKILSILLLLSSLLSPIAVLADEVTPPVPETPSIESTNIPDNIPIYYGKNEEGNTLITIQVASNLAGGCIFTESALNEIESTQTTSENIPCAIWSLNGEPILKSPNDGAGVDHVFLNARYYDSYRGGFVSIDPMFWSPEKFLSDPQSLNAYSYGRNNPVNLMDANGMMWTGSEWLNFAEGAVIGAGIAIGTAAVIGAVAVASPVIATVAVASLLAYTVVEVGGSAYVSYVENDGSIKGMGNDLVSWAGDNPGEFGGVVGGIVGCSIACKGATELGMKGANKLGGFVEGVIGRNNGWGNPNTLVDHFTRHGGDFGAKNPAEYARLSQKFYKKYGQRGIDVKIDQTTNDVLMYEQNSNTFGVFDKNGNTKSFFKPDPTKNRGRSGQEYFNDQRGVRLIN